MITLITGAPGAGKTAALVSMLEELGKDRAIYAHGIPDLQIPHIALDDPTQWPTDVPDGSIIVIDEVQTVWRPAGPGAKLPEHISKLETHRHKGLDFYIITQGPNLVHTNVRALVGRHVHLRDLGFFGRWWYEWPETADGCRTAWKGAPLKKKYKLPKQIFSKYKSASVHIKPVRSFPKVALLLVGALLLLGYLVWTGYGSIQKKLAPAAPPVAASPVLPGQTVSPSAVVTPVAEPAPFLDDRVAFIPRISNKPETAPAYDGLRVVVNMPQVSGGVCMKGVCKCVTQQGTDAGLTSDECKAWMQSPTFDNYRPQVIAAASAPSGSPSGNTPTRGDQTASAPARSEAAPYLGASNPRADARQPSMLPPGSPFHTTPAMDAGRSIAPPTLLNPYRNS